MFLRVIVREENKLKIHRVCLRTLSGLAAAVLAYRKKGNLGAGRMVPTDLFIFSTPPVHPPMQSGESLSAKYCLAPDKTYEPVANNIALSCLARGQEKLQL
jgi:hypothetical protein